MSCPQTSESLSQVHCHDGWVLEYLLGSPEMGLRGIHWAPFKETTSKSPTVATAWPHGCLKIPATFSFVLAVAQGTEQKCPRMPRQQWQVGPGSQLNPPVVQTHSKHTTSFHLKPLGAHLAQCAQCLMAPSLSLLTEIFKYSPRGWEI